MSECAQLKVVLDLLARYFDSLDKCRACDYYLLRKKLRELLKNANRDCPRS